MMSVTHLIEDVSGWRVVVELRRHQVVIEALIPLSATLDEIATFTENVKSTMRRKLGAGDDLATLTGGMEHGEAKGSGEAAVSGPDAPREGEEKGEPPASGKEGGEDPQT